MVFVSGQVPTDAEGNLVGAGDIRVQTRRVFENIAAVLAEGGATLQDVVEIIVFLRNIEDYAAFSEVRNEFLRDNPPASTLVAVSSLVDPSWLVEVRAVAVLASS
jgi:enamine deaminase RidA (YjgF/YER057c/UK114 family)